MRYYPLLSVLFLSNTILLIPIPELYAQLEEKQKINSIKMSTLSVDVELLIDPIIQPNSEVNMQINFLAKVTERLMPHIDYVIIIKDNSDRIIDRFPQDPQSILHSTSGIVTMPYIFKSEGNYKIIIEIKGILFGYIPTETAEFNIAITPEFPINITLVLLSIIGITILFSKLNGNIKF